MYRSLFTALFILFLPLAAFSSQAHIKKVRAYNQGKYVRVIYDIDQAVKYHHFLLENPNRFVVDINHAEMEGAITLPAFQHVMWIKKMRMGSKGKSDIRFVMDLTRGVKVVSSLNSTASGGSQLIVDLYPNAEDTVVKAADQKQGGLRDVVIVIDPGHGGKDSGAVGSKKTYEKKVVFAISKYLKAYIDEAPGMKAALTRRGDYFVSLRGRLSIARQDDADVFVAIHADKFKDSSVKGATVFALSQRGATSEAARWLAKNENVSELMGGVELADKSQSLRSLLLELSQSATIERSLKLGDDVLHHLDRVSQLHHSHVDQARFVVLKSPDIPSILVETGFLSNHFEENRLRQAWYQKAVAKAIFQGIKNYLYDNPPPNTKILNWVRADLKRYVVQKHP